VAKPLRIECVSESGYDSQRSQKQIKKEKLFIPKSILKKIRIGDELRFRDARNKKREILIVSVDQDSCLGDLSASVYLRVGIKMTLWRNGKKTARFPLKRIIPKEPSFTIRKNDLFYLVNSKVRRGKKSLLREVPCTLGKVLLDLRKGERVFFDDGKVLAIVEQEGRHRVLLRVLQSQKDVFKLKADKGINLPDSNLQVSGLTSEDQKQLQFVLAHADIVSLSFIKKPEDIRKLISLISKEKRPDLGLVLKIETVSAFTHLPEILIEAMKHYPVGVMIARGDLAVECGFERMAELQEEILWLCEAAGLPSIWATQVLESLAHSGVPSRAEISDAAMSVRAEAVMLNKGPYIHEAVKTLDNILQRMEKHQHKKRHLYRSLEVAFTSDRH
jgi:pyruvate kinase